MGRWRQFEETVRSLADASDAVHVVTGTLSATTEPDAIGANRVAVPTHFFKAVLAVEGAQKVMFAFILPNTANLRDPLAHFAVSVDEIERCTGLDLFASLEDDEESGLESVTLSPRPPYTRN